MLDSSKLTILRPDEVRRIPENYKHRLKTRDRSVAIESTVHTGLAPEHKPVELVDCLSIP
jgi:hypothetical protein